AEAHSHDPAFPHANILVVFATEWPGNDCRFAATTVASRRLNLNRSTGSSGSYCGCAKTRKASRLNWGGLFLWLEPLLRCGTPDKGQSGHTENSDSDRKSHSR